MGSCDTCFYEHRGEQEDPCVDCLESRDGLTRSNWVSMKFLNKVDDNPWNKIVETMSTTSKQGVKYDDGKARWELIPFRAMRDVVDVLTYGSRKYADDNWKIVPDARKRYISAAFRHLTDWAGGEKKDSETGKSHLSHAICCLLFLLWFEQEDEK